MYIDLRFWQFLKTQTGIHIHVYVYMFWLYRRSYVKYEIMRSARLKNTSTFFSLVLFLYHCYLCLTSNRLRTLTDGSYFRMILKKLWRFTRALPRHVPWSVCWVRQNWFNQHRTQRVFHTIIFSLTFPRHDISGTDRNFKNWTNKYTLDYRGEESHSYFID